MFGCWSRFICTFSMNASVYFHGVFFFSSSLFYYTSVLLISIFLTVSAFSSRSFSILSPGLSPLISASPYASALFTVSPRMSALSASLSPYVALSFFPPVSALFSLPPCLSALFFVLPCTLALLSVLLSSYVALFFFFLFFNNIYNLSFEPFKKLYLFTIWLLFLPPVYWFIFSLYNADVLSYIRNYFFLLSYSIFHSFIDVFTRVNLSEKNGYSFQGFVFSFLNPVSYNFTMFLFLLISSLYLNWKILHWFISEITSDEFLLFFCELAKIIT